MKPDDVVIFDDAAPKIHGTQIAPPIVELGPAGLELPTDFPANAKAMGDGSYLLALEYPVVFRLRQADGKISEQLTSELHLHRLKGKHQNLIRKASVDDTTAQLLACSARIDLGQAQMLAEEMDSADLTSVMRVVRFFQTPGRVIGRSSSPG